MKIDLKNALKSAGMSQQQLADALGKSKGYISELSNGKKMPSYDALGEIADALGAGIADILVSGRTLAVAGHVGAGARVDLVDDHAKGDGLYLIQCPPQIAPHGIVGVEVEGDSMTPYYQPGDVLLYTRDAFGVPTEALGKVCVCEDINGMAWVKVIRTGRQEGTFSLISVNPEAENMHGVKLKWAAPVRMHIPVEFVQKA